MFDAARHRLRETVAHGDSAQAIDSKVTEAGSTLDEERQAALWLYAWGLAGRRAGTALGDGAVP